MVLLEAMHMIYDNLDCIFWKNTPNDKIKYYYAEDELYLMYGTESRSLMFIKATSPKEAYEKFLKICG